MILPKFLATPNAYLSQITIVLPSTRNSLSPVKSLHIRQLRLPTSSPASVVTENGCPDARTRCRTSRSSFSDVPRIRPADALALIFGDCHDLDGVRRGLAEHRADEVDYEIHRSLIVAVTDELKVVGLGVNVMHRNAP